MAPRAGQRPATAQRGGDRFIAATVGDGVPRGSWRQPPTCAADRSAAPASPIARHGVADADLDRLAELAGIDPIWWDVDGGYHKVGADTKRALLAAMRLPAGTRGDFDDSLARLTLRTGPAAGGDGAGRGRRSPIRAGPAAAGLGHAAARGRQPGALPRRRRPGRPAAAAARPASPAERGPARTVLPPDRRAGRLLPAAGAAGAASAASASPPISIRCGRRATRASATSPRWPASPPRLPAPAPRWSASTRCTRCSRMTAAGPARITRPTGAFWTRSISTSPAFPAASAIPSPAGPVDYPAVWAAKRAVLHAAFRPRRRRRDVPGAAPLRHLRGDRRGAGHLATGRPGPPNCATRRPRRSRPSPRSTATPCVPRLPADPGGPAARRGRRVRPPGRTVAWLLSRPRRRRRAGRGRGLVGAGHADARRVGRRAA